jgi:hypothetical protein
MSCGEEIMTNRGACCTANKPFQSDGHYIFIVVAEFSPYAVKSLATETPLP